MKFLQSFLLAPLVAGLLMAASFPPLDVGWLNPVGWALLFASMRLRRGERAGRQAFATALVVFLVGVRWIIPLAWPLWLVVALWSAVWEALFGRLAGAYLARGASPPAAWVVVVPLCHLLTDMLRTTVLSGFPWMLPGYSGWRNPVLLGSMDLLGVHGATLAILMLGAGAAEGVGRISRGEARWARALVPAAAAWAALAAWTFAKPALEQRPGPTVLLLQPSIPQQWKEDLVKSGSTETPAEVVWEKQEELAGRGLADAARTGRPVDLVVWAETMVPEAAIRPLEPGRPLLNWDQDDAGAVIPSPGAGRRVARAAQGAESLAGIMSLADAEPRRLEFNTIVLLDADGRVRGHQDKQHLCPGGEYIPLRFLIPFRERFEAYLREAVGFLPDLQPGEAGSTVTLRGGGKAGVMICYESLFPEVPLPMVRAGADVLFNCSNYGWFAGTSEMGQALAVAAVRAAELRRSTVLASNNGVSCVIGPDGRVRGASTTADEPTYLLASAPLCDSRSPFSVVGEWGAWFLGAAGALACLFGARRSDASTPETGA